LSRNRSSTTRFAALRRALATVPSGTMLALAAAILAIWLLVLAGCTRQEPGAGADDARPLGTEPLLERTPEQFEADLARLRGRVVVVNFWASWCEPCREEMPLLRRTAEAYATKPVTIVGVDASDRRADALAFLSRNQVGFPTVFDPRGLQDGIANRWAVTGLPQTWFLGPDGSRSGRFAGAIDEQELRRRVDALLEGTAEGR
jgi:cytochrome c biogenesis protein CcmG, thiol:disulfide interchange protein DsbE